MTSPAKVAANRQNARKSTGPKTAEGKARSAGNAVTHGLTSQPQAHPGDPTPAFRESLAEWIGDLKPEGIVQRTLAERACRAAWNLRRCDRYEDATAAKRDRDAADKHDRDEAARAEAIGRRLLAGEPVAGDSACVEGESPATLVASLRMTSAGVAWMLDRWAELGRALKASGGWDESLQLVAVRLMGLDLEAARDHPSARKIMPPRVELSRRISVFDDPAMGRLLESIDLVGGDATPATSPARLKTLRALVRSERAKLARLMARALKTRADDDRAGAADRSLFDEARSLSLCLRYATSASRDLHRTLADLVKLRKEDADRDDGRDSPGPEPGRDDPPGDRGKLRNEPKSEPGILPAEGMACEAQSATGLNVKSTAAIPGHAPNRVVEAWPCTPPARGDVVEARARLPRPALPISSGSQEGRDRPQFLWPGGLAGVAASSRMADFSNMVARSERIRCAAFPAAVHARIASPGVRRPSDHESPSPNRPLAEGHPS